MNHDSELSRDQVWQVFDKRGWSKVVINFSGGNDSGGADSITVTGPDGTEKQLDHHTRPYNGKVSTWNPEIGRYVFRPATAQEIADSDLVDVLEKPVYDRYYSFAGDFEVSGTVVWDAVQRTVTMNAEESRTEWDRHSYEL